VVDEAPTIDPVRTALLVMDYQRGIIGMLAEPDALVTRAARAIATARERGITLAYVRVAFQDTDYEGIPATSRMGAQVKAAGRALHAGAPDTEIDERLAPHDGDIVVRKTRVGAFSTTYLDALLRARGIDTLIVAGISTSGVVLSTIRDAYDRDYALLVLADACADRDDEVHEFLIGKILPRQASVISTGDLQRLRT
jgi:nicotinamidase-related amidase